MKANRRIAAVMWTYGRPGVAEQCVRALLAQKYPLELIVAVDSASPDDTVEHLRNTFGDGITVLELADNLGPGAAIVAAFEHLALADITDVWLVEDDSRPGPDSLAQLVSIAETVPTPAMVGPDGADLRRGQWRLRPRLPTGASALVDFVYLDGALLNAEMVRRIDGPRSDYFVMMVDVEYPLRLRTAGVTMVQAGVSYESLRLGATSGGQPWRAYYQSRNHLRLAVGHRSPALLAGFIVRTGKQAAYAVATGSWDQLAYRSRGIVDAIRGRMGRTVEPPRAQQPASSPHETDARTVPLLAHSYSTDFDDALHAFLATRGGDKWHMLHGNGPRSRMARFESSTLRELILHTGELDDKRVLDFGCGSGTITPSLALRAKEVIGFDVNAEAVSVTRARLHDHRLGHVAVHHAGSYREVADELGAFDVVIAHAVFEHVPLSAPGLRADVIRQAFDALVPGGHLFISESPNRLVPRDIYCTGLWFVPWTRGGSTWAFRRAIRTGRHTDPHGRGPISLEERGAWGLTYWTVRRALRDRPHGVVNAEPGHDRWVRYHRKLSVQRRAYESAIYHLLTRPTRTPIVAFAPMLSPLVVRRRSSALTPNAPSSTL